MRQICFKYGNDKHFRWTILWMNIFRLLVKFSLGHPYVRSANWATILANTHACTMCFFYLTIYCVSRKSWHILYSNYIWSGLRLCGHIIAICLGAYYDAGRPWYLRGCRSSQQRSMAQPRGPPPAAPAPSPVEALHLSIQSCNSYPVIFVQIIRYTIS